MELKIICQCGQKYKFDVEPVNGRMPFSVNCPICHADGTPAANTMLAHQLAVPPKLGQASSAPPPPMAAYQAPPPPVHAAPPPPMAGLKINREAPPAPAQMAAIAPPPLPGSRPMPSAAARPAPVKPLIKEPGEYSLVRGILGAVIGSVVGCGLMYGFYLWAEFRFPLTGCAVGAASGYAARLLARGTDSTLGFITAGIAVASLAGTFVAMYGEFPITAIISLLVSASFAYRISSG
jgi:hypothetical protein